MSRLKSMAAAILALIALTAVLFAPSIYLSMQEDLLLGRQYERDLVPVTIDPEAEEIYLVRAIRDAYYLGIGLPKADEQELRSEWAALSEWIPEVPALPSSAPLDMVNMVRSQADGKSFLLHEYRWFLDDGNMVFVTVHRETKTGKLIYLELRRSTLQLESSSQAQQAKALEGIGRAYCAYLGLEVLEDWSVQEEGLVSEKASLKILCENSQGVFSLIAAPLESQLGNEWSQTDQLIA